MLQRRSKEWSWLCPLLYGAGALLAGAILPRLEVWLLPGFSAPFSNESAIAIFSSVAAGMMSLTAIVFSLVFVMAQFSAITYSPRLALALARDPLLFHGIGIFTATFIYALVALAWVNREGREKVPFLTTALVYLLLVASVMVLARLVQRVSFLRITNVLAFVGRVGRETTDKMFPPIGAHGRLRGPAAQPELPPIQHTLRHKGVPRVIESFDNAALVVEASRAGALVEMVEGVGETVIDGAALAHVRGGTCSVPEGALRRAIHLGPERTFEQDPRYALRVLVDIAIKGLSPAINDPTTAVQSLDYIEDFMVHIGKRQLTDGRIRDASSILRLIYPEPTWEDFVHLAFDEIRFYGASSVQVMRRMRALLRDLLQQLPAERQAPVQAQLARVEQAVVRTFPSIEDLLDAQGEDRHGLGRSRPKEKKAAGA